MNVIMPRSMRMTPPVRAIQMERLRPKAATVWGVENGRLVNRIPVRMTNTDALR
jgi:hypothetical protein